MGSAIVALLGGIAITLLGVNLFLIISDGVLSGLRSLMDYLRHKPDFDLYIRAYLTWEERRQAQISQCEACKYRQRTCQDTIETEEHINE